MTRRDEKIRDDSSERQILVAIHEATQRMENKMSELSAAVTDLQGSVAALSARVGTQVGPLLAALAQAQQNLSDFTTADNAEDADFQAQIDALLADQALRLSEAQAAATAIEASVGDLNTLAQPPVEPTP